MSSNAAGILSVKQAGPGRGGERDSGDFGSDIDEFSGFGEPLAIGEIDHRGVGFPPSFDDIGDTDQCRAGAGVGFQDDGFEFDGRHVGKIRNEKLES